MDASSPERRRRANGLSSADWAALVDLDPRLSEGLLDRLAQAGVAAYVEPAAAVDTVHRAVVMPGRPLDRLWVDPSRADSAREVVASEVADLTALLAEDDPGATAHGLVQPVPRNSARRVLSPPELPEPPARGTPAAPQAPSAPTPAPALSDDDVFAQIVAGFHTEPAEPGRSWPAAEDLPAEAGPEQAAPRRRRNDAPPEPPSPALPAWMESQAFEDESHYVPPPPPPVPRIRARTLGAVLAAVLGVLVLFAPRVLHLPATQEVAVLGMSLLAGGAGALVWWMRDSSTDSGPDDGAIV